MRKERFTLVPFLLLTALLTSFHIAPEIKPPNDTFTVVLDAGHGGHDPGNLGNGFMEKNIALNIVLAAGRLLEQQPNIKVVYTRKDDSFVDLFVRGQIANKADADLFVSVHCDSHSSDAHGAGTFVLGLHANEQNFEIAKKENSVIYLEDNYETRYAEYDIDSPESIIGLTIMQEEFLDQSIMLAKMMQDNFTGKLKRNDRKVKQAGFIVLHQTFMPSVLVETGFLTNKSEGNYLNSKKGQQEMGRAIADAIISYKNNLIASEAPVANLSPAQSSGSGTAAAGQPTAKDTATSPSQAIGSTEKVEKDSGVEAETQKTLDLVIQPADSGDLADSGVAGSSPAAAESSSEVGKTRENVRFKVQLLASSKDIPLTPKEFNGLDKISREPYKNLYRYLYGDTDSYQEALRMKANADQRGYGSSYIVAYRDGQRIALKAALKYIEDK